MTSKLLFRFLALFFTITSTVVMAQTDEPCGATNLIVGANGTCSNPVTACINPPAYTNSTSASSGVTLPANSCGGFTTTTLDFWYRATVPASGKLSIIVSDNGTGLQISSFWDMALYTSSSPSTCVGSSFTQIASECATGTYPNILVTQPPGTVIFIRMWREAASAQTANRCYSICAIDPPLPPACTQLLTPANGASIPGPEANFSWNAITGATSYEVFLGTANPPASIGTITNTSTGISGLAFNTTYYWSVTPKNAGGAATGCHVFSFTTQAAPPPPANNECATATELFANARVSGTTVSATQSQVAEACAGFTGTANDDVWYKFTTVQAGTASFTLTPEFSLDAVLIGYSGTCGGLVNMACADAGLDGDPETITFSGLAANTTYYIRAYAYSGAGSEGSFTILGTGQALPVSLANFKGERQGNRNILTWTTISEQNNNGFELQRSADGNNFSTLGFIPSRAANGNSNVSLNYAHTDSKPFSSNCYYRLKQIDKDGREKLSGIVLLKGTKHEILSISNVYPNPARDKLNLIIYSPVNEKVTFSITDLTGRIIRQQIQQISNGENNVVVNVSNLTGGTYLVNVKGNNSNDYLTTRFVKQ